MNQLGTESQVISTGLKMFLQLTILKERQTGGAACGGSGLEGLWIEAEMADQPTMDGEDFS